jgi:hypothetical protein
MRNIIQRPGSRLLLLLLLLLGRAVHAEPEKVTFRFAPPDGTTFEQTLVQNETVLAGARERITYVTRTTSRLRFAKTADGYTLTSTPVSITMDLEGEKFEDPLLDFFETLAVTYHLDAGGNIRALEGYEALEERLEKASPDETSFQLMAKLMQPETFVARDKEEWHRRISSFAGRTYEIGSRSTTEFPITLAVGKRVLFHTVTELVGKEKCGDRVCVRLRFRSDADVPPSVERLAGERASDAGGEDVEFSDITMSYTGERLIDPATMLIYSETQEWTVRADMAVSGDSMPFTQHEKREYTFEYAKGAPAKP